MIVFFCNLVGVKDFTKCASWQRRLSLGTGVDDACSVWWTENVDIMDMRQYINPSRYGSLNLSLFTILTQITTTKLAVELVNLVERNPCCVQHRRREPVGIVILAAGDGSNVCSHSVDQHPFFLYCRQERKASRHIVYSNEQHWRGEPDAYSISKRLE